MHVARLSLTDFRNHASARIEAEFGFVILTGENGAGKTNVLEAVSLLAPGRGLRRATLSEMARGAGPGGFAVAAALQPDAIDIGTGTTAAAPERRQVRINGAGAAATALAERLSVLWLTPAMDRLFLEGASGRRQFLDRLVLALEPGHAAHSARYEAAMRARNKLLAEPDGADPSWLAALETGMAEHGARIGEARERTVAALGERLAAQPEGPFASPGLMLNRWRAQGDAEQALRRALRDGRGRDAAAGRTLTGPHRTDMIVTHRAKDMPAERCSTGEQKALLLSTILAHAGLVADRTGRAPILLLDEVAAHLDPERRSALFDKLAAGGGQVWMTGTEPRLFEAVGKATWLNVRDGVVQHA